MKTKNMKKMIGALVLTLGVSSVALFGTSLKAEAAPSLTSQYNSYAKQVTTLSNQVSKVKSRSAAWNLMYKMERLSDQIDYLEDRAEYSGSWSLARKCDRLDDKLDLAKDRLEYRWGIDD